MKKPITCINDNLNFSSLKAAAEHYGVAASNISAQLSGRIKHISGLTFQFTQEENNEK